MNNNKLTFSTASFYTSFLSSKKEPNSFGSHRQFLQSPLWKPISNTHKPVNDEGKKQPNEVAKKAVKNALQQAIYILPKSPSHVSIYLQLAKFRSLSVLMRCGHVSQLVENWLCNPMEQLKRNAEKNQQYRMQQQPPNRPRRSSSSPLCIMPSPSSSLSSTHEAGPLPVVHLENASTRLHREYESTVSVHFQIPHEQQEHIKIRYANVPCLFTVVCVTYHCGTVSLSVNQIDSLDFLLSPNTMNPFLVQCNLVPQHPVTVHQLVPSSSSVYHQQLQICDFENNAPQHQEDCPVAQVNNNELYLNPEPRVRELHVPTIQDDDDDKEDLNHLKALNQAPVVELLHYKETLLYQQESDDDEESGMFTSDEDFSLIEEEDDIPEDDREYHYHKAGSALLELVQDTLQYIQSSGGALTDELNSLVPKLLDYCSL
ncbi:hypothetical protein HMPREF1544_06218 [Mucor circinelloides 1006PhL]|uniref:Uncharacterized protein n=1 Tax=Mucor circinelloides f. circinelloides (strain 1006PhL) TaxID=1220926 RepID=S2K470_MUCC1|nr:hypothetical protein HMPREF1544_06218 [Mucor circinelloides 1006PhL]KAG1118042.1 hypothetical protein G6F42_013291 [Rhizopus arrhizus]